MIDVRCRQQHTTSKRTLTPPPNVPTVRTRTSDPFLNLTPQVFMQRWRIQLLFLHCASDVRCDWGACLITQPGTRSHRDPMEVPQKKYACRDSPVGFVLRTLWLSCPASHTYFHVYVRGEGTTPTTAESCPAQLPHFSSWASTGGRAGPGH